MPRPPPEAPSSALARCGIGWLSIWLAGGLCGIDPVTSPREAGWLFDEPKPSAKRPESALQPAAPSPINEMATSCGQMADRGDAHMVTHSHATKGRANKQRCGKQGFKCRRIFFNK